MEKEEFNCLVDRLKTEEVVMGTRQGVVNIVVNIVDNIVDTFLRKFWWYQSKISRAIN